MEELEEFLVDEEFDEIEQDQILKQVLTTPEINQIEREKLEEMYE